MTTESDDNPHDTLVWLLTLSQTLLSTHELDKLLGLVVKTFLKATEAERGFLLLAQQSESVLRCVYAETRDGRALSTSDARISSLAEQVSRDGTPIFSTDLESDQRMDARESIARLGLRMMVCVPLKGPSGIVGVIYADGKTTLNKVFTVSNRRALEALADHAGAAIENAKLYEGAIRDPLTGLFHSGFLQLRLGELAERHATPMWLVVLDLHDLSGLNSRFGPKAGDQIVVGVADSLRAQLRHPELAARIGAGTFGLCLAGSHAGEVAGRVETMMAATAQLTLPNVSHPVAVRLSAGYTHLSPRVDETMARAQSALVEARSLERPVKQG